jgi:NitT/TauT family transport system permease protein
MSAVTSTGPALTPARLNDAWKRRAAQIAIVVVWLVTWQLSVDAGLLNTIAVASPSAVVDEVIDWAVSGRLLSDIANTMSVLGAGYLSALVVGTAVGVLMGVSRFVRQFLDPFIAFLNSLPRLVLIPILLAWLGFGKAPQILLVFLLIVFMVIINVYSSIADIPREILDHGRMLGASWWQLITTVYLPAIGIWVINSARIAVGLGFQAAVVSEFFGSSRGLGYTLATGQQQLNSRVIYAAVVVTALLAVLIDFGLGLLNRRVARWMPA